MNFLKYKNQMYLFKNRRTKIIYLTKIKVKYYRVHYDFRL